MTAPSDKAVDVVARALHRHYGHCNNVEGEDPADGGCPEFFDAGVAVQALRQALSGPHGREVAEGLGMAFAGRCSQDDGAHLTESHFRLPTKEAR